MFTLACPEDLVPIFRFVKFGIYPLLQIGIPIILIIMGSIDLGKAVLSSDDKEIKAATGKLVKRAIAAVAVFFITTIVSWLFGALGSTGSNDTEDWKDCWSNLQNNSSGQSGAGGGD